MTIIVADSFLFVLSLTVLPFDDVGCTISLTQLTCDLVKFLHTHKSTFVLCISEDRYALSRGGLWRSLTAASCRHLDRFVTVLTDTLATLYESDACVAQLHGGRVSSHHEDLTASVRGG